MVTGYAPLGGPGETTVADGFTLLENPTGMSSIDHVYESKTLVPLRNVNIKFLSR